MKKAVFTFEEWVPRVFVGRVPTFSWVWDNVRQPNPTWLIIYSTRLFENPEILIGKYSNKQLRKGFWSLPNNWELSASLWEKEILWKYRKACIQAMVSLFEKFFAQKPLGDTCFMWWDFFRYFGASPDERVTEEMFVTLTRILRMESENCQAAALHGLGHLGHPQKVEVINSYLNEKTNLSDEMRKYAQACIGGNIL